MLRLLAALVLFSIAFPLDAQQTATNSTPLNIAAPRELPVPPRAEVPTTSITKESLKYIGSFRLPAELGPATVRLSQDEPYRSQDQFGRGGFLAYDRTRDQLLVGSWRSRVAAVNIPTPLIRPRMVELPRATRLTPFVDVSNDTWNLLNDTPSWDGEGRFDHKIVNDRIITTGTIYYDANNSQRRSHIVANLPLSADTKPTTPWRTVGSDLTYTQNGVTVTVPANQLQGHTAGFMFHIPVEYQAAMKGDLCTGQSALPIISRQSLGPECWAFYSNDLLTKQNVPANFLVGYPMGFPTLGTWEVTTELFGMSTTITGGAIIGDTMLFFGRHGYGPACYGVGVSDQTLAGKPDAQGQMQCYDPTSASKGTHAYPYRGQVWAYPMSYVLNVAAGKAKPWDLIPRWWELEMPFPTPDRGVNGVDYDPVKRRLYVAANMADIHCVGEGTVCYEPPALIHVYEVVNAPTPTPVDPKPTPVDPTPIPVEPTPTGRKTTYQVLAVAAAPVPIPAEALMGMTRCWAKTEGARVRFRMDGTDPTTANGYPLNTNEELAIPSIDDARRIRFIRLSSTSAKVHVRCE